MIIEFQLPCYVQGHQPLDQAVQSHIQPGLECLQGWGIHNLLGQPAPVRHHPLGEKIPSNIQPKPPLSQFKTTPPSLSLSTLVNSRSPSCLYTPFKYQKATMRSPQSLLRKLHFFVSVLCLEGKIKRTGKHGTSFPSLHTGCFTYSIKSKDFSFGNSSSFTVYLIYQFQFQSYCTILYYLTFCYYIQ